MTKRKILMLAVSLCMVAILVTGGTLAYLTDTDAQNNVFTVGNVAIDLYEDFGDNNSETLEKLLPATGSAQDGTLANGIEKEIYVKNTGSEDAYVRVHIAIPAILDNVNDAGKNVLHFNYDNNNVGAGLWDWSKTTGAEYTGDWNTYTTLIGDIGYNVYVVTYETALAAGAGTCDAIHQVYMDKSVTNEQITEIKKTLGDQWHIYVVAEGGQAAGFDNAYEALNEQFGVPGTYTPAFTAEAENDTWVNAE